MTPADIEFFHTIFTLDIELFTVRLERLQLDVQSQPQATPPSQRSDLANRYQDLLTRRLHLVQSAVTSAVLYELFLSTLDLNYTPAPLLSSHSSPSHSPSAVLAIVDHEV